MKRRHASGASESTRADVLWFAFLLCNKNLRCEAGPAPWAVWTTGLTQVGITVDSYYTAWQMGGSHLAGAKKNAQMTPTDYQAALKALLTETSSLRTLALRHTRGPDGEEAAQRVSVKLWRLSAGVIAAIVDARHLRRYANRAVRNCLIDIAKQPAHKHEHSDISDPVVEKEVNNAAQESGKLPADPLRHAEDGETLELVLDSLSHLPQVEREVLLALKVEERTLQEVAGEWGITVDQVRGACQRGLMKLVQIINNDLPPASHTKRKQK